MIENLLTVKKYLKTILGNPLPPLEIGITKDLNALENGYLHARRITLEYYLKDKDVLLEIQVLHTIEKLKIQRVRLRYPDGRIEEKEF